MEHRHLDWAIRVFGQRTSFTFIQADNKYVLHSLFLLHNHTAVML